MSASEINWEKIGEQATEYLSQYLQIDTTNPPGNETRGAEFLRAIIEREGISNQIVESEAGRGSIIASLKGDGLKRPLLLLSHIDVVPAEGEKWIHPPFSGMVVNGEIWGRGALDCKSLGIIQTMVLLLLKKSGQHLSRDLILAATADEEKGGNLGVRWLCDHRPDLIQAEAVINEGGGVGIPRGRNNFYFCQVAEKGVCWVRIIFTGNPGHASLPREDNCVLSLGRFIERIGAYRSRIQVPPITMKFLEGLSGDDELRPLVRKLLEEPHRADEFVASITDSGLRQALGAMIRNTFVPTVVRGGEKTNVIPSECFCEVDCRMVQGETPDNIRQELEALLHDIPRHSIHINQSSPPSESSYSHPLYHLFEATLALHDPKAKLVPFISSGATDSRYFRSGNTVAFGFAPLLVDESFAQHQERMHGHNERISRKDLLFGIRVLYDVVRKYCA